MTIGIATVFDGGVVLIADGRERTMKGNALNTDHKVKIVLGRTFGLISAGISEVTEPAASLVLSNTHLATPEGIFEFVEEALRKEWSALVANTATNLTNDARAHATFLIGSISEGRGFITRRTISSVGLDRFVTMSNPLDFVIDCRNVANACLNYQIQFYEHGILPDPKAVDDLPRRIIDAGTATASVMAKTDDSIGGTIRGAVLNYGGSARVEVFGPVI